MKKNYDKDTWLKEQEEKLRDCKNKVLEIAQSFQTNPEEIAELLAFKTKFYRYSLRNTMLIYSRNPYATFTASYQGFKKMGWSVQKNAQKLPILVPVKITYLIHDGKWIPLSVADEALKKAYRAGEIESEVIQRYKIGYVYDISQTNCPPEQYPKFYNMGAASMDHKLACDAMKEYAETRLVIVYVNGQYWGIYDLNENQNEDYMAAHYGVDPDAVDIIRRNIEALAGRNSENKRVRAWALATDTSDPNISNGCTRITLSIISSPKPILPTGTCSTKNTGAARIIPCAGGRSITTWIWPYPAPAPPATSCPTTSTPRAFPPGTAPLPIWTYMWACGKTRTGAWPLGNGMSMWSTTVSIPTV